MKKLTIGLSAAALALAGAGIAFAQPDKRHGPDADGDGVITRAEMQTHAAARYARMDLNKDGKIDQTDHEARRKARREKMFDHFDANDDGQISKAEFDAGHERGKGKHRMGRRGKMMQMADTNEDGAISEAEFTAGAMKRFDRFDADGDGQITKEERARGSAEIRQKAREMRKEPSGR